MTGQIVGTAILALAAFSASAVAQSSPRGVTPTGDGTPRCLRLAFLHDSATAVFPDRLQWSATDSIARFGWDTSWADAREMRRQIGGHGRWYRFGRDSIVIRLGFTLTESSWALRFKIEPESIRGVLVESGSRGTMLRPFVAAPQACPVRDHAS
jgi:hypothetical protein